MLISNHTQQRNLNEKISDSKRRMQKKLRAGGFREHIITNNAVAFSNKEDAYLEGYLRFLKTKNFMYILECK